MIGDSIDEFCSIVDDTYRTRLEREYGGFVAMDGYLLERKCLRDMYSTIIRLFPFVHSLFALVVSSRQSQGDRLASLNS
jgi:hypothetical protein